MNCFIKEIPHSPAPTPRVQSHRGLSSTPTYRSFSISFNTFLVPTTCNCIILRWDIQVTAFPARLFTVGSPHQLYAKTCTCPALFDSRTNDSYEQGRRYTLYRGTCPSKIFLINPCLIVEITVYRHGIHFL